MRNRVWQGQRCWSRLVWRWSLTGQFLLLAQLGERMLVSRRGRLEVLQKMF